MGRTGKVIEIFNFIFGFLSFFLLKFGSCFFVFHVLFVLEIIMLEPMELGVVQAGFDVEGQRDVLEDVLAEGFIVVLHVQEERLLVVHVEVVLDLIIQLSLSEFRNVDVIRRRPSIIISLILLISILSLSFNILRICRVLLRSLVNFLHFFV